MHPLNGEGVRSLGHRVFTALAKHVPVLAWLVYSGLLVDGRLRVGASEDNYFKYLAEAFLHGRLNVTPGHYMHDLVHYHGKIYLYWPPMPAVALMPLVHWMKTETHDNLLVATLGALNVALLLGVLGRLSRRYQLELRPAERCCIALFWAFGTTHYYLSTLGRVWYVSEVMAQTFLLLSVLILLKGTHLLRLIASGLCFAAAAYTRNDLVFAGFFLAALYYNQHRTRHFVRDAAVFLLPFALFSVANVAYNAARFDGRWFDNGTSYHDMSAYFREKFVRHGFLSLYYIPYNFWIEVLRPVPFIARRPYIQCDPEGFGFVWASPLFFLGFPTLLGFGQAARAYFGRTKAATEAVLTRADTWLMTAAAVSAVAIALVVFSVMGTGWGQFGSRYSLDYQLMVLVFCLFSLKLYRGKLFYSVALVLLAAAVYIQHTGTHCSL